MLVTTASACRLPPDPDFEVLTAALAVLRFGRRLLVDGVLGNPTLALFGYRQFGKGYEFMVCRVPDIRGAGVTQT